MTVRMLPVLALPAANVVATLVHCMVLIFCQVLLFCMPDLDRSSADLHIAMLSYACTPPYMPSHSVMRSHVCCACLLACHALYLTARVGCLHS
jgi:hypothetical protein